MSFFFFFKQKTAYEMRISDRSSDVCSSDLVNAVQTLGGEACRIVSFSTESTRPSSRGRCREARQPGSVEQIRKKAAPALRPMMTRPMPKIGRASGRERVCQDV